MIPRLVSVIIPTYDRPDYLREAVDSVFAQTYPFIEILVIDDGSSAGGARTKSALKPYLSPDSSSPRMPQNHLPVSEKLRTDLCRKPRISLSAGGIYSTPR